jgi:spore coat-associated protein S
LDINEFKFYETLSRFAIHENVLKLLPFKPLQIQAFYDDGYILESDNGNMALWVHWGRENSLACQVQILEICMQQGLPGFLYPLPLSDGRTYAELNEVCWFFITPWPRLQKIRFSYTTDLLSMVNLLTDFRKVIVENGFLFCLPERKLSFNLLEKYHEIVRQLNSFDMLARHRLRPTTFDRIFLSYLPEILNQTKQAIEILEKTGYFDIIAKLTPQDIIMNKLTRHNLRIAPDGGAICLRLDDYRWDLPIIDLAILLIKTGRSAKWEKNWLQMILQEYEKSFKISSVEMHVIHAFLSFPWSFYRLASRYYYNRVDWPLRSFVEKMERLVEDEENRIRFLKDIQ